QRVEAGQVVGNGDIGRQQRRVAGAAAVGRVVAGVRVDTDEGRAALAQALRRGAGQERVALEVGVGPPVARPAGVDEYGLAGYVKALEGGGRDGSPAGRHANDHRIQVRQRRKRQLGQILAVGVAVEGRIDVG